MFLAIALIAAGAGPATGPYSTVGDLQKAYHHAVRAGDAAAIHARFIERTPQERAVVDAMVQNDLAANRLVLSIEKEFGVKLIGGGTYMPIDERDWQVQGDAATVTGKAGQRPFPPLAKTGDGWKIDPWSWGIFWTANLDEALKNLEFIKFPSRNFERVARHVAQGVYWSLDEVRLTDVSKRSIWSERPANPPRVQAPRPATRPAVVDLSTPRAAYETFAQAMIQGDSDALLRCTEIVDPLDRETMALNVKQFMSASKLHTAAVKQFGAEGWKIAIPVELPGPRRGGFELLRELDATDDDKIKVSGNEAVFEEVSYGSAELIRIGKEWKIKSRRTEQLGQKDDPGGTDWGQIVRIVSALEESFSARIAAGEFADAKAARKAIEKAVRELSKSTS
jgi:hypothetical protein